MADPRQFLFTNNATASLGADVLAADGSIALVVGHGARFPSPGVGQIFKLTLQNTLSGEYEIMNCTSRTDDTLLVERESEGTTALDFDAATTVVQIRVTAETLEKLQEAGSGGSGGPVGAPYITYAADATLSAEKVLAAEVGVLSLTDEGSVLRIVVVDSGITNTKFRQSSGLSVVGRGSDSTGSVSDIIAATDGGVLRRDGNTVGFGNIAQASVIGLVTALNNLNVSISSIQTDITNIQTGYTPTTRTIATQHSLTGGGDLTGNRTLNLVGDVASPGASMLYGTDASGVRGWYAQPSGGGVADHGALTGLADDDHTQYHTNARGDARYPLLTRAVNTQHSVTGGGNLTADRTLSLDGDTASPGNNMLYGTNGAGARGWYAQPTVITDHGGLGGLADDDHTQYHTDARGDARYPPLARTISTQHSLTGGGSLASNRTLSLVGDVASPGNNMVYGTNASGTRGWYAAVSATDHGVLTGLSDDDHPQYLNDSRGDARYPPLARAINTQHSLTGGGDLTGSRTLNLVGDVAAPGNNILYGTNASGVRGWTHTVDEAANASTIVRRDSTGRAFAVYFNQSSANAENPTVSQFMVTNGTDGYMRKASIAHVRTQLGLVTDHGGLSGLADNDHPQYPLKTGAETISGAWSFAGAVGISSTMAFGSSGRVLLDNSSSLLFRNNADSSTLYTFDLSGNFTAAGNVTASSDARLKDNIEEITQALSKIKAMRGVTYDRRDTQMRQTGLIAQDVRRVLPEAVIEASDGYLAVAYGNLAGLFVQAIKELESRLAVIEGVR